MFKFKKIWSLVFIIAFSFFLMLSAVCLADETDKSEIPVTCPSSSGLALQSFLNGREAFEMGRIDDAKALFDIALLKDPQLASAYLYKAYAASSDAEWKRNIDMAEQYKIHVSEGEKILIDMESALSERNSEKRFTLAKHLAELYPSSSRAQLILAGEHQVRKEYTKFRDLVTNAIMLAPDSPLGYRALASSYLLNEPLDFSLAQKYMEKFVNLRPNEPTAYIALGDVHRAYLSFGRAAIAYGKAIKLDPENDIAYSKRGYVNIYQGIFDVGRKDWEMARNLAMNHSKISWPNTSIISYLYAGNRKLPINETPLITENGEKNNRKNSKHPLEAQENDHYFCCTVVSMRHGVYVSPFQNINECQALQREFTQESKAPDSDITAANIIFIEGMHALLQNDFDVATQKAEEHARMVAPDKNPRKLEIYNYLMGLINLKQDNYGKAMSYYLKSDLNNACVKFELGLAYDGLGEWEKAQEMFNAVSDCNFTTASKPQFIKLSKDRLNVYAMALKEK